MQTCQGYRQVARRGRVAERRWQGSQVSFGLRGFDKKRIRVTDAAQIAVPTRRGGTGVQATGVDVLICPASEIRALPRTCRRSRRSYAAAAES